MALVTWLLRKHFPDWEETLLGVLHLVVDLRRFVLSLLSVSELEEERAESYHRNEKLWEADGCSLLATERES